MAHRDRVDEEDAFTALIDAEARLYALEAAVRMLVTIVMRDQPQTLARITTSIRENAASNIDREFHGDAASKARMRKATLDALEQILTAFRIG